MSGREGGNAVPSSSKYTIFYFVSNIFKTMELFNFFNIIFFYLFVCTEHVFMGLQMCKSFHRLEVLALSSGCVTRRAWEANHRNCLQHH